MEDDSIEPSHAAHPNWLTFSGSGRMTAEIEILPKKIPIGKRFRKVFRFNWPTLPEYLEPLFGPSLLLVAC